jgi:hypothetical protein
MLADGRRILPCVVGFGDEVGCSWIGLVAGGLLWFFRARVREDGWPQWGLAAYWWSGG